MLSCIYVYVCIDTHDTHSCIMYNTCLYTYTLYTVIYFVMCNYILAILMTHDHEYLEPGTTTEVGLVCTTSGKFSVRSINKTCKVGIAHMDPYSASISPANGSQFPKPCLVCFTCKRCVTPRKPRIIRIIIIVILAT